MTEPARLKVAVVGGSVGGLTSAIELRAAGCDVDVYERSATEMKSRGGGIVLQQNLIDWFKDSLGFDIDDVSTRTDYLRYFGRNGEVLSNRPRVWRNTSWSTIYQRLLGVFGAERYHKGATAVDVHISERAAEIEFADGTTTVVDLAVFADGIGSTGRAKLSPHTTPQYAGYIGWRGTVPESELSDRTVEALQDSMSYYVGTNSHIILYPIPGLGGELNVGERLVNYVWYRNVPAGPQFESTVTDTKGRRCQVSVPSGDVQPHLVDQLRLDAADMLPELAAEVVSKTAQPYIQVMQDIIVDRMAYGRAVLLGDAAMASRPHAAAWTAKAVSDSLALVEHLVKSGFDVPGALEGWEPEQLEIGRNLFARVQEMGTRSQFENSWVPGDPAFDFGLYGAGI